MGTFGCSQNSHNLLLYVLKKTHASHLVMHSKSAKVEAVSFTFLDLAEVNGSFEGEGVKSHFRNYFRGSGAPRK